MFVHNLLFGLTALLSLLSPLAQAQSCSGSSNTGTAAASSPFWLQNIGHNGKAPYNSDASYKVFRNVRDFGAKGDGVTDDTAAFNQAIASGNGRCGNGSCPASTTAPALVYVPAGTYLISSPIVLWYYTQLIGDAKNLPVLKASSNFAGIAVLDADPYGNGGVNWYVNQNNFFRSARNFIIDLRSAPVAGATGIHWQVSQATSLMNIRVEMSTASGNNHQGMFMENGSGGYMGDLIFNGGKYGIWVGNQQFTVRNITINNAQTAIYSQWNWGWTFQGVTINNCGVGFDLATGGTTQATQSVGTEVILDAVISNTPIGIRSSTASNGSLKGALLLNNVRLTNVPTAVGVVGGAVVLSGGTKTIAHWGQGNVYTGSNSQGKFVQADLTAPSKDASLLDSSGRIFGKTHPQYANYDVSQFVSIRSLGAKGDGSSDDTAVIQNALNTYAGCKILFFDHGAYYITDTITIPPGTRMVGEAWSILLAGGSKFQDQSNPRVAFKVGASGSSGVFEATDIIFSTKGPAGGAIVVEWNMKGSSQGATGLWDSHIRLGGAKGTNLDTSACAKGTQNSACMAAFMALHFTAQSTAYLEGTWVWLADHLMEDPSQAQISLFSGRGIVSESQGPQWWIGTGSEHHAIVQYSLVGAKNHYMGLIQTETPYYQPSPAAPAPFSYNAAFKDPQTSEKSAWGLWVQNSSNILVFGAGLYSFFSNYAQDCLNTLNCQNQMANIDTASTISIYGLSTVGTTYQLSIGQTGVIKAASNPNGFQQTVTAWTRS